MPDSNDPKTLQARVADARELIASAVRVACRKYNHSAPPQEVEELTEQITVLLLEQDCRRMQTHNPSKASFKTWLQHVVNHHVSRQLQKNSPAESPEDELLNTLSYPPAQEKELLWKERRAILEDAIDKLSLHDQRITRLKLREVPDEEIAQELNIKAASVGRERRVIKTKLAQMVRESAQSKAKQSKAKTLHPLKIVAIFFLFWHPLFVCEGLYRKRVARIIYCHKMFGNQVIVLTRRVCFHLGFS